MIDVTTLRTLHRQRPRPIPPPGETHPSCGWVESFDRASGAVHMMALRYLLLAATLIASAALLVPTTSSAQTVKRGAAALGQALSDMADRESAMQAELELARRKADIEFEQQKRLLELKRQAEAPKTSGQEQERILDATSPGWRRVLRSKMFGSWLDAQYPTYRTFCSRSHLAGEVRACIESFFDSEFAAKTP